MQRNRSCFSQAYNCPILCITKAVLFVTVSLFILYLPLGDPQAMECSERGPRYGPVCCLCDVYWFIVEAAVRTGDVIEKAVVKLCTVLYEIKLMFYSLLEKFDRNDLCRSVCCTEEWEEDSNEILEPHLTKKPRQVCRCIKKKCCKQKP